MNVFIVEDSAILLEKLLSTLSDIPGVAVIGHAVDEAGAIERINALRPDVVTLDIRLQSGSGLGVLNNIRKHHTGIKVIVLTNCTEKVYVNRCKRAGADYFFDKTLQLMQFLEALQELAHFNRFGNKLGTLQISAKKAIPTTGFVDKDIVAIGEVAWAQQFNLLSC